MNDVRETIEQIINENLTVDDCEVIRGTQDAADAVIDALPAIIADMVEPLEFSMLKDTTYKAEDWTGIYTVYPNQAGGWTLDDGMAVSGHANAKDAQDAAGPEQVRRILTAIGMKEGK